MVGIENSEGVPRGEAVDQLGQLHMRNNNEGMNGALACDALALVGATLAMASVAGPASLVKAFRAALFSNTASPKFDWARPGESKPNLFGIERDKAAYNATNPVKLGHGLQHVIVWLSEPSFMLTGTEEALWQRLEKTTTTPLLREWMPVIYQQAVNKKAFLPTKNHNCSCGFIKIKQDDLDRFVSYLVKTRQLTIPEVA